MNTHDLAEMLAERLDKIESKLDRVQQHTGQIDVTLAAQAKDIAYHIKRTDALEARVEQVAEQLRPVKEHVARLKGVWWVVSGSATLVGIAVGVAKLLGY